MTDRRNQKPYAELEFTDGFMFRKIMITYPEICRELLELILGKKIRSLKMVDYEKTVGEYYESKGVRMDVYTEDEEDTAYDIEMQASDEPNVAKRSRYYHSSMDSYQLKQGAEYTELKKSIVVFICRHRISSRLGGKRNKPVYMFSNRDREDPEVELGDETYTVLVNGQSEDEGMSDEWKDLISLIRSGHTSGNEENVAARIEKLVEEARLDGRWSTEYIRYKQAERDIARKYLKEERAETERQRRRADDAESRAEAAENRADTAEKEIAGLRAELESLKSGH